MAKRLTKPCQYCVVMLRYSEASSLVSERCMLRSTSGMTITKRYEMPETQSRPCAHQSKNRGSIACTARMIPRRWEN